MLRNYISGMGLGPLLVTVLHDMAKGTGISAGTQLPVVTLLLAGAALTATLYLIDRVLLR